MTNIIVGKDIIGSLTSSNPTIVDPASPFNGQFYDDFDISSLATTNISSLPFGLAAIEDIGSIKIGEVRSTNIFLQSPAGTSPTGTSTTIQLINKATNNVDAQATSNGSEPLQFIKNAELVGSDYKIRLINPISGDYKISLAGAIPVEGIAAQNIPQGDASTNSINPVDPNLARNLINGLITDTNGNVIGAARGSSPSVGIAQGAGIGGNTSPSGGVPPTSPSGNNSNDGASITPFPPVVDIPSGGVPPSPNNSEGAGVSPIETDSPLVIDPLLDGLDPVIFQNTANGGLSIDPQTPVEGVTTIDDSTTLTIDPTLDGLDPVIFQNAVGGGLPLNPQLPTANAGGNILPGLSQANIALNNNFLTITGANGFGITAVSQKAGSKVSEIGMFTVDDATGKIGGIVPGAAGYLQAASNSVRSIFSTLGGSFFDSSLKREIALDPNKIYGFFEVQDGSIADLKQQLALGQTPTNILSSLPNTNGASPIKITDNGLTGGYNVSFNNDQLVLKVVALDGATPNIEIGAKSQGLVEGRTIDLTGLTGTLKADITTKSSAAYTNNIGFYVVENAIGTIKLANGQMLNPGEIGYAAEAIKNAILQAGKTDSKIGQDITGGKIYAPVVTANGSFSDFLATNPANTGGNGVNAFFNYVGANFDKVDHFRLIGDNTFGVEDQLGGGDRDFNDLVINMKIKTA